MVRDDWHFDHKILMLWLDKCSLKEGFDLSWECTSALWGFGVLRFLWQLSTPSQVKQDPFTLELVSSALIMYLKCTWQVWCEPTYYYLLSSPHCCLTYRWWISPLTGASREPCQSLVNFIFVLHMYLTRYSKCSIIFCTITLNKNKPNECTCEKRSNQLSV